MLAGDKEYSEFIKFTKDWLRRNTKRCLQWFLQNTSKLQQGGKEVFLCVALVDYSAGRGCRCLIGTFPRSAYSANCKGWKTAGPLGWERKWGTRLEWIILSVGIWRILTIHKKIKFPFSNNFIFIAIFCFKILSFIAIILHGCFPVWTFFFYCIYYFKAFKIFQWIV